MRKTADFVGGKSMSQKTKIELNNAIFSLPDYVARDNGYFEEEGLQVELVLPEKRKQSIAKADAIVEDPSKVKSTLWHEGIEKGEFSVYHACEWGQMRRSQDSEVGTKVVMKRAAVSTQAIIVRPDAPYNVPQDLRNVPVGVNFHAGSHYIVLGLLSGFMDWDEAKTVHAGVPNQRFSALQSGQLEATALMEPWISVAEKLGFKIIAETFYYGLETIDPSVDADTVAAMNRAHIKAVDKIREDITPYLHYIVDEVPQDIVAFSADDLNRQRLRYNHPEPLNTDDFEHTYNWMVAHDLLKPESNFEKLVASH